jgi:hypothetical protein
VGGGRVEEGLLNGVQDQSSTHRHDLYDCTNGENDLPQPGRSKSSSQKHFDALALTVMRMRQCGFENCFWNVPVEANVYPSLKPRTTSHLHERADGAHGFILFAGFLPEECTQDDAAVHGHKTGLVLLNAVKVHDGIQLCRTGRYRLLNPLHSFAVTKVVVDVAVFIREAQVVPICGEGVEM